MTYRLAAPVAVIARLAASRGWPRPWPAPRTAGRAHPRSIVPVLDGLLAAQQHALAKIGSRSAPRIGHERGSRNARNGPQAADPGKSGRGDRI